MSKPEWTITFDGKNRSIIQDLVGRMQNQDGDVDVPRVDKFWGKYQMWIGDAPGAFGTLGAWVDVKVGDTISKVGSMWVPKYGDSPIFRVTKGENV